MLNALTSGFLLGLSLILAIGAQNAFVLRQGLRRAHVLAVCLTCATSDALLIALGIAAFGTMLSQFPWLLPIMRYGGAAFLAVYGLRSFYSAIVNRSALRPADEPAGGLAQTILVALTFTWLNPHVYLDTVVLLGSAAAQFGEWRLAFGGGAMLASFVFFFALGYGARFLSPFFARPGAWAVLDTLIGIVMCGLAIKLLA